MNFYEKIIYYFYLFISFLGITIDNNVVKIRNIKTENIVSKKIIFNKSKIIPILTMIFFLKSRFIRSNSFYWKNIYITKLLEKYLYKKICIR